jgi:hypothetical protein
VVAECDLRDHDDLLDHLGGSKLEEASPLTGKPKYRRLVDPRLRQSAAPPVGHSV